MELEMDALSWGAATLEKAFLGALITLLAGGAAPSAFLMHVFHLNVTCRVGAFWAPADNSLCLGKDGTR